MYLLFAVFIFSVSHIMICTATEQTSTSGLLTPVHAPVKTARTLMETIRGHTEVKSRRGGPIITIITRRGRRVKVRHWRLVLVWVLHGGWHRWFRNFQWSLLLHGFRQSPTHKISGLPPKTLGQKAGTSI